MLSKEFMSRFPHSDQHELNLDWVLKQIKALKEAIPTRLAQLQSDSEHQTVTAKEKENWNAGGVSKTYVDEQDTNTLTKAKEYTDKNKFVMTTATDAKLGGVKAAPSDIYDTDFVHIDETGHLRYTPGTTQEEVDNAVMGGVADANAYTDQKIAAKEITYRISSETSATKEILPNIFYKWDKIASLNITFGKAKPGVVSEYCFEFRCGSSPTKLTVPNSVKWVNEPKLEANKTYQVSVVDNIGVIAGA